MSQSEAPWLSGPALITRTVPGVRKAAKWKSPLYGAGDAVQDWFISFHCFTKT